MTVGRLWEKNVGREALEKPCIARIETSIAGVRADDPLSGVKTKTALRYMIAVPNVRQWP